MSSKAKFSIVRVIMTMLNLGEEGKISSFFLKVEKRLKREINILSRNLETVKSQTEQRIEDLTDQLQDANDTLNQAYYHVDLDNLQTNESQSNYVEIYLDNIDSKLEQVRRIQKQIEEEKDNFEKFKKETEEQITSLQKRIDIITKEED